MPDTDHGYDSPFPSRSDIERAFEAIQHPPRELPGIDLREDHQLALQTALAPMYADLPWGHSDGAYRYSHDNTWFTRADAIFLALLMRHVAPRRIIEVGCGFSSAVILDVNDLWFTTSIDVTFVEPNADRLRSVTRPGDLDDRLIEAVVQDVPTSRFAALEGGDMLLIDSSHMMKAGSDVKYLFDEVLPRLASGVWVHVHDVLYPFEYPRDWLDQGTAFNEAYALRYLLQGGSAYRIELFPDYLATFHGDLIAQHFPLATERPFPTGGLWLRRV
ncbi:MAG: class I SAM-dependent methyltransferase [Actinomycetota bacterium]